VRNIAGFRPGASYMGTFGYPLALTLAEQKESPWPPFHVTQGFEAQENAVTVGVRYIYEHAKMRLEDYD
jgi:hypothetical protein